MVQSLHTHSLELLRGSTSSSCRPSGESIAGLQATDLVLMSGQFVGAGKSTFIQALGRANIASWTNRELRSGVFYATPAEFNPGGMPPTYLITYCRTARARGSRNRAPRSTTLSMSLRLARRFLSCRSCIRFTLGKVPPTCRC